MYGRNLQLFRLKDVSRELGRVPPAHQVAYSGAACREEGRDEFFPRKQTRQTTNFSQEAQSPQNTKYPLPEKPCWMSVINFKFRSETSASPVHFDGPSLSVFDLKREIITARKIKGDCDLAVLNSQSEQGTCPETREMLTFGRIYG